MRRVILDTNMLWNPVALRRKDLEEASLVLPAFAFVERARQIRQAGRQVSELWHLLEANDIFVEDFEVAFGLRLAANLDQATWDRHARDALIAGHVGPDDVLWTKNPKDFEKVGLARNQILGV